MAAIGADLKVLPAPVGSLWSVPWTPPPPTFHEFLDQVLTEIPEFRPTADEQLELSDGEYYATRFFDAFSSAVMDCQGRIMNDTATERDAEIVERWLRLGEQAMVDPFVAEAFLETAGDDFLLDQRGQALRDRTGPELRRALERRRSSMDEAIRRSKVQTKPDAGPHEPPYAG